LRRRTASALALSQQRLDFGFVLCPRSGTLVLARSWQRLWVALALLRHRVEFVLTLWWQRLGLAHALVRRRLELLLVLSRWCLDFAPGLALCPGCQRLGPSGGGSLNLASGFDAGGFLGQGWYSARDRQRSPSFVRVNA
jgi:hypothetical protein